jgi:hypothetical protein
MNYSPEQIEAAKLLVRAAGTKTSQVVCLNGRSASHVDRAENRPRPDNLDATEHKEDVWPSLDDAAYYGLAGDIVKTIAPHTEADPVAVLAQVVVYFGNVIGRSSHYRVEADFHHTNLFCVLVGRSSKGRKGVSGGRARSVVKLLDERWADERMKNGLSSGEGLINEVRDEVKEWDDKTHQEQIVHAGVADKRLMVTEPEFANSLAAMERHGNVLSSTIRNAWDGGRLSTLTKNSRCFPASWAMRSPPGYGRMIPSRD